MKCAVVGYGAVGKAVEEILLQKDCEVKIFSRRGELCGSVAPAFPLDGLQEHEIDLAFLCVGSAEDSLTVAPKVLTFCDTIDCFDDHINMKKYLKALDDMAREKKKRAISGAGWDPGIFSVARKLFSLAGKTHTFYGEGVSLGHSNAVKNIFGVKNAICYTIPLQSEVENARRGGEVRETAQTHKRRVVVVPCDNADRAQIAREILGNPYYRGYDTTIEFCGESDFFKHKDNRFHQGKVFCAEEGFSMTLTASMKDNAYFTARIMTGLREVIGKLEAGAYTLADIPPALFSDAFY